MPRLLPIEQMINKGYFHIRKTKFSWMTGKDFFDKYVQSCLLTFLGSCKVLRVSHDVCNKNNYKSKEKILMQ